MHSEFQAKLRKNILSVLLLCTGICFTLAMLIGAYPDEIIMKQNPSFIDIIFQSEPTVFVARLLFVILAIYVVVSVVGLIWNRRWLIRIGPLEASEPVEQIAQENETLKIAFKQASSKIEELEKDLDFSQKAFKNISKKDVTPTISSDTLISKGE